MTDRIDELILSANGTFFADFTAIDVETTGLTPGHVIEIAAVRVRMDGSVAGEFSSLINPGPGIDPGPQRIHRISRTQLDSAPPFADVLGRLLELLRGSVLVAHNLPFDLWFLTQELTKLGVVLPRLPAVCSLTSARTGLLLPNYRLTTVADALGVGEAGAHTALSDARMSARIVSSLVNNHRFALTGQPRFPELPYWPTTTAPVARNEPRPVPEPNWLAGLIERIPDATASAVESAYVQLLVDAFADVHLSAQEAAELSALATEAGFLDTDIERIHRNFVNGMRAVALRDGVITASEYQELTAVATALTVPDAVHGLTIGVHDRQRTRVLVLGNTPAADQFRAAILGSGIQLAQRLTPSVSHLVFDSGTTTEPRIARAAENGIPTLDLAAARTVLLPRTATEHPSPPPLAGTMRAVAPIPAQRTRPRTAAIAGGRSIMGVGLLLMFFSVFAAGGGQLGVGLFIAILGVLGLLGGWKVSVKGIVDT